MEWAAHRLPRGQLPKKEQAKVEAEVENEEQGEVENEEAA